MTVFVVTDTLGAGRVVGVFESRERAEEVVAVEPAYYRLEACELGAINPAAADWAQTPEQRRALDRLSRRWGADEP